MADASLYQRATIARFKSQCGLCPEAIVPRNDRIVHVEGRGYCHVECAEAEGYEIVEPESPGGGGFERPDWWDR